MNTLKLKKLLESFLIEDVGDGDLTSQTIFTANDYGSGEFIAKDDGIIAGLPIIEAVYNILSTNTIVKLNKTDGERMKKGEILATVEGPVRSLLTGERVILNLLQRLSGVASLTNECIIKLNDDSIRICDTRKTTPGLRSLEKYAVRTGGGFNHRTGLYDAVMIKDNHIAFSGSITEAVNRVRKSCSHVVKIEVETESKEQVLEAVEANVDIIMFDNKTPEEIRVLREYVPNHIITEASGGITPKTIHTYKGCGVDYISLGFLTHSAQAKDISFLEYLDQ